ncbi:prepilin-type N-terminal cleavage/methylation domain-containing protein [Escherichia coli]|nr:prepilin-type N-terminal cleavage/methylation domain-containing protein [Escherichia coli]EFF2299889.1 prepilin-type N-terminal cleavage/methylation domain-containing protein [Escherichia coli]EFI6054263.1 prepilin-type N-terminal cleavage/methylation domain-containing protein [Escherichia coli]EGD1675541.1 prepilin-type N-terminal cleavage/methylation domain-containing protein [Escherichia coli]EGD9195591.1 hypothetical protein [Escherichia coli]
MKTQRGYTLIETLVAIVTR